MTSINPQVGQSVELNDGRRAIVHFRGPTGFAPGDWVGVVLEDATGKNDGSVKGDRYFTCEPNYGMFMRVAGITRVLEQERSITDQTGKTSSNGVAAAKGGPSTKEISTKGTTTNGAKRQSTAGTPTAAARNTTSARPSGLRSPLASPTKQLSSAASTTSSRTGTPSEPQSRSGPGTIAKRTSLAPSSTIAGRRTSTVPLAPAGGRTAPRPSVRGTGMRGGIESSRPTVRATPGTRQSLAPPARRRAPSSQLSSISGDDHDADEPEDASPDYQIRSPTSERESSIADSPELRPNIQEQEEDVEQTPKPVKPTAPLPTKASEQSDRTRRVSSPTQASTTSRSAPQRTNAAINRELEDLQTKLRILEKRRLEDRERLKTLERVQQERDRFESIIQKLQTKYQPQQQEIADLRRQVQESEKRFTEIENIQAEHDAELENATLDREMAEEQSEALKIEVVALREKAEEAELELEVLREENQELSKEMSPEERTSQGWLNLEKSNERLREALMRLRDVTQDQEADLRQQIQILERDAAGLDNIKQEAESLKEKLLETEAFVEDLKQQMEVAQGGEEMIEELSDRNMTLQEQMEELKATIEDLENLKEVSDELEVNHVETEKQMQEEIDFKDSVIGEQTRRSAEQHRTIEDYELTVSRFREAFRSLQADLEDMRASQQISETEASELSSRSRALQDLNLKLQTSASKTQVKAIDLELRRLDAEEAAQHLSIVQLFLPDAFSADRESIQALLRFKRIAFKANLVHGLVKEKVATTAENYDLFIACSVLDRLAWISGMSEEFVSSITACGTADFARYQGVLYELEPVERALNSYVESLKRDELDVRRIDEELQRSMAVLSHLASVHLQESLASTADDLVMRTSMLQSHLETAATALALCKSHVQKHSTTPSQKTTNGVDVEQDEADGIDDDDDEEQSSGPNFEPFFERMDTLISSSRGAKVLASKAHRELLELRTRSLGLDPSHLQRFTAAQAQASTIATFARQAGTSIRTLTNSDDEATSLLPSQVAPALKAAATSAFSLTDPEREPLSTMHTNLRSLTDQLHNLATLTSDLSNAHEFERPPAPWVLRAQAARSAKTTDTETEAALRRLNETLHERNLLVRTKERELDEQSVRVEMLEARMKEAGKSTSRIAELEDRVLEMQRLEKRAGEEVQRLSKDASRLRGERDEWRGRVSEFEAAKKGEKSGMEMMMGGASRLELDRAKAKMLSLQAAVRFLTMEKERLRRREAHFDDHGTTYSGLGEIHEGENKSWLYRPLVPPPTAKLQKSKLVAAEGKDVLRQILSLAIEAKPVDLSVTKGRDRLGWRPVRETSAWTAGKRREEWEGWCEWRDEVADKARSLSGTGAAERVLGKKHRTKVDEMGGAGKEPGPVEIVDADVEHAGVGVEV